MKEVDPKPVNKLALVWKKTVYDNGFNCTRCGAPLFDTATNQPTDNLGFDPLHPSQHYCMKCKLFVCYSQAYDGPELPGLFGHVTNARGKFRG